MRLITSGCVLALVLLRVGSAWSQEKKVADKAARTQSANNLRQIGKAMHAYTGLSLDGGAPPKSVPLPTHAIYSKDGKTPLLSWRVALLPYLEQEALYKEFRLDEPWDSEHNKKLIPRMPKVYDCSAAPKQVSKDGKTFYQVFTGEDTVFAGNQKIILFRITDGTSNTILAIEAKEPVIWTKPEDLTLPKDKNKMPAVGGLFKNGFNVLFFDGEVDFFRPDPPPAMLRALVTPAGGEKVDVDKLRQKEK
jgi:Protein of unknown function (DUF1559)